jgi:hypothetical protein
MTCALDIVMYNAPRMEELNTREKRMEPFFGLALRDLNRDKFGKVFPWKKSRVRTGAFSLPVSR